jgi:potassium-transporting ATPase ATP-binding subunit
MTSDRSTVLPSSESVSTTDGAARQRSTSAARSVGAGLLDPKLLWRSVPDAFRKLDPRTLWRNPVMFVVEIGSIFTTVLAVLQPGLFAWAITIWLWLTVLFANLAEAVAEGRGKAQAATLRRARKETAARRLPDWSPGAVSVEEEDVRPTPSS